MEVSGWKDYQSLAAKTVVYPGAEWDEMGLIYSTLGLVDEIGEAIELVDPWDESVAGDRLIKEMSDILWYVARVVAEFRLDFDDVEKEAAELEDDTGFSTIHESLSYMMTNAAQICGQLKKYIRDENYTIDFPSKDKCTQVQFRIASLINGIYNCLQLLNISLEEVMSINLDKLYSRKERGKLQGSGDRR